MKRGIIALYKSNKKGKVKQMGKVEKNYNFKGIDCVKLSHGKYFCVIAVSRGASVLRLRDEENKIDVFR